MWILGTDGILVDRACQLYALSHDEEVQWFKLPQTVQTLTQSKPVLIPKAISLIQLWGSQVYHFSVEAMGRLHLLRRVWEGDPTMRIIVPAQPNGDLKPFMKAWLELMKVDLEQVWLYPMTEGAGVFVQELHMADWRTVEGGGDDLRIVRDTGRLLHYLPPKPLVADIAAFAKKDCAAPEEVVLFVSRGGRNTRQFTNETSMRRELVKLLKNVGPHYKLQIFGDSPVPPMHETRALFASAKIVIGAHGAGMGNIIFCAPGTHIVELAVRQPHGHYFAHLAVALDMQYWWVPLVSASAHFRHFVTWEKQELLGVVSQIFAGDASCNAQGVGGRSRVDGTGGGGGTAAASSEMSGSKEGANDGPGTKRQKQDAKPIVTDSERRKGSNARTQVESASTSGSGSGSEEAADPVLLSTLLQRLLPTKRKLWGQWGELLAQEGLDTVEDLKFLAEADFEALRAPLLLKSALRKVFHDSKLVGSGS
jgi:hypothetical protein